VVVGFETGEVLVLVRVPRGAQWAGARGDRRHGYRRFRQAQRAREGTDIGTGCRPELPRAEIWTATTNSPRFGKVLGLNSEHMHRVFNCLCRWITTASSTCDCLLLLSMDQPPSSTCDCFGQGCSHGIFMYI
jgi:hypothetical protein